MKDPEQAPPKLLFLCAGNSCRSQMAEGWARYLLAGRVEAHSAGIAPSRVHPDAIAAMAQAGVDISNQRSKHVDEVERLHFDLVVTLCDDATEPCPVFPGKVRQIHKAFKDPAGIEGTREEVMAAFRNVRDEIRAFIETLPDLLDDQPSKERA